MADHLWQKTGMTAIYRVKQPVLNIYHLIMTKTIFLKTSLHSKAKKYILKHFHYKSIKKHILYFFPLPKMKSCGKKANATKKIKNNAFFDNLGVYYP